MSRSAFLHSLFGDTSKTEIGSIWKVKNRIWKTKTAFGRKGIDEGYHPGLVVRHNPDDTTLVIAPGSSQRQGGRCKVKVASARDNRVTHFILKMSMPMEHSSLVKFNRGIGGRKHLNAKELLDMNSKVNDCLPSFKEVSI